MSIGTSWVGFVFVCFVTMTRMSEQTKMTEENSEIHFELEEITFEPQTMSSVTPDEVTRFEKLIDMLNECDDVQEIYHNAELPN